MTDIWDKIDHFFGRHLGTEWSRQCRVCGYIMSLKEYKKYCWKFFKYVFTEDFALETYKKKFGGELP